MIELRCAIEFVQERRRPSAVILRRRDKVALGRTFGVSRTTISWLR
jgi:hypothetical protein